MPQITTVGVLGAGTMGHGIAHVSAQAGYATVLYDVSKELADRGRQKIADNLAKGVEKGKVKRRGPGRRARPASRRPTRCDDLARLPDW